jgi:hypothetical protein
MTTARTEMIASNETKTSTVKNDNLISLPIEKLECIVKINNNGNK